MQQWCKHKKTRKTNIHKKKNKEKYKIFKFSSRISCVFVSYFLFLCHLDHYKYFRWTFIVLWILCIFVSYICIFCNIRYIYIHWISHYYCLMRNLNKSWTEKIYYHLNRKHNRTSFFNYCAFTNELNEFGDIRDWRIINHWECYVGIRRFANNRSNFFINKHFTVSRNSKF